MTRRLGWSFIFVGSFVFAVGLDMEARPHPGIVLRHAHVTIRPFHQEGLCRVKVRSSQKLKVGKWSSPVRCANLYVLLRDRLAKLPTDHKKIVDIEAAPSFVLNIKVQKGEIRSFRPKGLLDRLKVDQGNLHLSDHPDSLEALVKRSEALIDVEKAIKEIEATFSTHRVRSLSQKPKKNKK